VEALDIGGFRRTNLGRDHDSLPEPADWVSIRKVLEGTRNIQRIGVDDFDMSIAHVQLDYVGKIEQLQTALAQSNIYLIADDKGNWTLSRNASTAAATSPAPVVP
jgi:hypothetical protein